MGTQKEKALLLIDTQADGTAIKYDSKKSGRSKPFEKPTPSVVKMVDWSISGSMITD